MAIKIDLNTNVVPVEIGTHKFIISMTDELEVILQEKLDAFMVAESEFQKKASEEKSVEIAYLKPMMKEVLDTMLGEGAFELIYQDVPNSRVLLNVMTSLLKEYTKVFRDISLPPEVQRIIDKKVKEAT